MTIQAEPAPSGTARTPLLRSTEGVCRAVRLTAIGVALPIGLTNLAVWYVGPLQQLAEQFGFMVMRANACAAVVLAGIALCLRGSGVRRHVVQALGALVAAIGGVTVYEHIAAANFGFDEILTAGTFPGDRAASLVTVPGRMSMNAALALFFLGLSLVSLDWRLPRGGPYIAPTLAILAALPAALGLVGYLLGVGNFMGLLRSTTILLHAAIAIFCLALCVLALHPERQPLRQIFAAGAEGLLLRWLLPGSAALLIALAWMIGRVRTTGLIAPGEGTALMLYGGLVLLFGLLFLASGAVGQQQRRAREIAAALHRAKDAAESANRAKDQFIAALSHELRTPLMPVMLTAAGLRDDPRLPTEMRPEVEMIARNVSLEARLIDDLLDLTRAAHGKLSLRRAPCDAHAVLEHALEIVRDEARRKQLALAVEKKAQLSGLDADATRLQQLFWNVLQNAVKFTPPEGKIAVATRNEAGAFVFEVTDTGAGFERSFGERLFDPFEQAGRQNDARFGGLGLGLAIARRIVELHGGTICAFSEGPGCGARFTVTLPDATAALVSPAREGNGHPAARANALSILLVEDHVPTLEVLTKMLRRAGHDVATASSVAAALETASAHNFDALVSDIGLPDGTGLDLLQELQKRRDPFIAVALSGFGTEEDITRSRSAGFVAHLVKPLEFAELQRVLREHSGGRAAVAGLS